MSDANNLGFLALHLVEQGQTLGFEFGRRASRVDSTL